MAREVEARLKLSAVDRTAKAFHSVQRNLREIERQVGVVGRTTAAMNRGLGGMVATSAAMFAPLAGAAGLQKMIRTAADFESQLTEIQKKGGFTAEQIARIGEEAKELSRSQDLAVPLEEILGAYERGAAAGLPIEDLKQFARLSAMAADAFEMSAEDVGNAAAGFNISLGIPMEQLEAYFGLINKLADSGIANESDLIAFLDRAGANLKLFGLTAEQAAAYGATLANIKMEPETAARMMNTLTSKLLAPGGKKARAALGQVVGDVDRFQKLLKKDANQALELFVRQVGKLDKFKAAEALTGFLGAGFSDEVLRLAAAYDELGRNQQISADRASWADGLSATYKLKLDDFWSQWEQFKNDLTGATIDLGQFILPPSAAALRDVSKFIEELKGYAQDIQSIVDALSPPPEEGAEKDTTPWWNPYKEDPEDRRERHADEVVSALKNPADPVKGLMGAREMDGVGFGNALARIRNSVHREPPAPLISHRDAERESMDALREAFGRFLTPDGEALRSGVTGQNLIDELDPEDLRRAVQSGGDEAGDAIESAFSSGARKIAEAIRSALSTPVQVNVNGGGASSRVNADVGRSGGDVTINGKPQ